MAAKDNKEMSAFAKAKRDRETLLGQVERCESSANLAKLQQKEKNLAPPRQTLKPSHAAIIAGLDNKLAQSLVVKAKLLVEKEKEAQLQASLKKLLDDENAAKNQLPSTNPTVANLSEVPTIDVKKEKRLAGVRAQLTVMSEKAKYFSDEYKKTKAQRYLDAYNAAQNLISNSCYAHKLVV
ncbi:hypothetical protein [Legionella sp. km772]|uniref:hypothetical protein n=1 Tax=Legionella sp. km772 TaxID=2498111 RepID=UPI000F8DAEDC|nr:hypothetical protein [Legionella sp. km772]RUR04665.1 hypothetical protein ELY15_15245 [Legionella sp. km772]